MEEHILHVIVRDRNKVIYDGPATGLTSRNVRGNFDILADHENFVSLVNETLVIHRADQSDLPIPMNNAIIKVKENKVEVFVGVKR